MMWNKLQINSGDVSWLLMPPIPPSHTPRCKLWQL